MGMFIINYYSFCFVQNEKSISIPVKECSSFYNSMFYEVNRIVRNPIKKSDKIKGSFLRESP